MDMYCAHVRTTLENCKYQRQTLLVGSLGYVRYELRSQTSPECFISVVRSDVKQHKAERNCKLLQKHEPVHAPQN
jgi:hypothetical protein